MMFTVKYRDSVRNRCFMWTSTNQSSRMPLILAFTSVCRSRKPGGGMKVASSLKSLLKMSEAYSETLCSPWFCSPSPELLVRSGEVRGGSKKFRPGNLPGSIASCGGFA